MSDLALSWNPDLAEADLTLAGLDLATDEGLESAVIISLFTDRRAAPDDVLPEGLDDRQGWWGDTFADVDGDQIGSRLWLLRRAKRTVESQRKAIEYVQEALAWLVEDGVAASTSTTAEWLGDSGLALTVAIVRPAGAPAQFKFALWEAMRGV